MSLLNPIAMRTENPIDGMYKILSAMTKPTLRIPKAGENGMIRSTRAVRSFLKLKQKYQ